MILLDSRRVILEYIKIEQAIERLCWQQCQTSASRLSFVAFFLGSSLQYDDFVAEMVVMLAFLPIYMKNIDEELKKKRAQKYEKLNPPYS